MENEKSIANLHNSSCIQYIETPAMLHVPLFFEQLLDILVVFWLDDCWSREWINVDGVLVRVAVVVDLHFQELFPMIWTMVGVVMTVDFAVAFRGRVMMIVKP